MPTLTDNLRQWRDSAQIDWFSQFIKAWIPFNAWMTDSYGDISDSRMLDEVKAGGNVVYNKIVPMLTWRPPHTRETDGYWQNSDEDADEMRLNIDKLHRLLQSCVVEGRKGRVSFETVDIGYNAHVDESRSYRGRNLRVRRNHPVKGKVTIEMTATASRPAFLLVQDAYDRNDLEDEPSFQELNQTYRSTILNMYELVVPRKVISVLGIPGDGDAVPIGETTFINDPDKLFSALVDVIYNLRNALFHGAITPNEQHNEIYEPAYHIVLRFVRCTI